ncbi:MAG: ATP-binding protein [Sulfurovum sp.]|uniref:AAA family ATPase n=1 Tax=Sulfurovum sp. TaxID=1969726 RepID=UPI002867FCF2|nr:AAA family ATPase [Sulfurovum sp.]MCO4844774.1 ATP-binding protein [Sulfurovum sp.]
MQLLEYFQNLRYITENYVPRKCQLPLKGDINLYGVRGAGKTTIILDLMHEENEETTLYIDLENPNLFFNTLSTLSLQQYIDRENITMLILDHYKEGYLPYFPNVERLIVLSRILLDDKELSPVELFPLDYEEFLAFETSAAQSSGFNHFLRSGTLPLIAKAQKTSTQAMKTFLQSSFDENEQKLLLILAQHHTKHLTTHQIYTFAKEKFKVSKDWLYKTMKLFTQEKLVLFIEDRYQKSGKKMLLFDFAFAKYLTLGQPFIIQFDTMIALALIKHDIKVQTLGIHGYVTTNDELIIPAPFESEESLWVKSQSKFSIYKKYGIKKVTIVTVANAYEYNIEKLYFEAIPFNEWSVINAEE